MLRSPAFKMRYSEFWPSYSRTRFWRQEVLSPVLRIFNARTRVGGNMKMQRIKAVALSTVLTAGAVFAGSSYADQSLNALVAAGQSKVADAQKSQLRINKLQDEANDLIAKFKQVNKNIEGLKVYNTQLDKQIGSQLQVMKELEAAIGQVTVIQRQIEPLTLEMLDAIEQFVKLDAPYQTEFRLERIAAVRALMDDAKVSVSEKFRQVLEVYGIESEYARKVDTYETALNLGGQELQVDVVAIGRIALMYQTKDGSITGAWDRQAKQWVELDAGQSKLHVRNAIRIAQKKAQNDIMLLPIAAPEAAK